MTLHGDECYFCEEAEHEIRDLNKRLQCAAQNHNGTYCSGRADKLPFYSRPVLMQHFPLYRKSDAECEETDIPEVETYREQWEVLSKDATDFLLEYLKPRVAFSGHTHHYCYMRGQHLDEYTVASFSWRNKPDPSFLLVSVVTYEVWRCGSKETFLFLSPVEHYEEFFKLILNKSDFHPFFRRSSMEQIMQ